MRRRTALGLLAVLPLPAVGQPADPRGAILHLLRATFDRPDAPLQADPIVIVGDRAIVDWAQGGTGGRALLHQRGGAWTIVLCSGAALKGTDLLRAQGVPPTQAGALARALAAAEARLDAGRIALFDSFEGLMLIEAEAPHPPHATPHPRHPTPSR